METVKRHEEILRILNENYSVKVSELTKQLFVSEATIRRDLEKLEKGGHLKRYYGGAVKIESVDTELPFEIRKTTNERSKQIIAQLASRFIRSSNIISMDSSTTVLYLCDYIKRLENVTVLTHGVKTASELLPYSNLNVYISGGLVARNSFSLMGDFTRNFFNSFYTDAAFISCKGISMEHGISWAYDEEASLRKLMLANTKKRILLCDSSKFNSTYASTLFGFDNIDTIITDKDPGNTWNAFFEKERIELICP